MLQDSWNVLQTEKEFHFLANWKNGMKAGGYQGPDSDDAITGPFLDWFNLGDLSVFFIDGAV